jgi:arabinogalactan endo-1,4-beta-galactosidase
MAKRAKAGMKVLLDFTTAILGPIQKHMPAAWRGQSLTGALKKKIRL